MAAPTHGQIDGLSDWQRFVQIPSPGIPRIGGGNTFYLWQGFQGRAAERHVHALARRVAEDLRSQGYGVAVFAYEPGTPGSEG